ncbi:TetR family transcriptional regulator [Nocardia alni]|uniref:TetR family transcriptional regulator n=1 Tax=Nocardia alni TaxID=2815723 RepID=UPI001C21BF06|nr:TetR family transcriptional regulator [Nocardia alni]
MPRWEPNAVDRLQEAAIELFAEQGFDRTTVAEIAERAGLTERTFFNHFPSKREVLFGPRSQHQQHVVGREIVASPVNLAPLDAMVCGLQAAADEILEGLREASIRRRAIIEASPELQERDDSKRAALTAVIAEALQTRGLDADTALLTARVGVLIHQTAEQRWVQPGERRPLRYHLSEVLRTLRMIVAENFARDA